jgi:hypothetical protein
VQELPARVLETIRRMAGAGSKDRTVIVARYVRRAHDAAAAPSGDPWPRRSSGAAA